MESVLFKQKSKLIPWVTNVKTYNFVGAKVMRSKRNCHQFVSMEIVIAYNECTRCQKIKCTQSIINKDMVFA